MTSEETAALVAALRGAYREALVAQMARDERYRSYKDKDRESVAAWERVRALQQQLMEGTEG